MVVDVQGLDLLFQREVGRGHGARRLGTPGTSPGRKTNK
ncbi:hypothetical protein BER2_0091 [plant metagenome]|uniref:Uncharacterized protein n=1 Tax=plant metagenome TaxID=1297885 RepID=A0A484U986_9ZZZZ